MPFYEIRVFYNALVYLLYKTGLNPYFATHFISAISICLGFLLLLWGMKRENILDDYLYLALPFLSIPLGVLNVARIGTADGLTFLFVSCILVCLINYRYRKFKAVLLLVLPLSVMVRTDLILFAVLIYTFRFFYSKNHHDRLLLVTSLVCAVGTYFFVNIYYSNYGWTTLIHHTFYGYMNYPANSHLSPIGFYEFFSLIKQQTISWFNRFPFWSTLGWMVFYAILCVKTYRLKQCRCGHKFDILVLGTISCLYIVMHLILFPSYTERHFLGQAVFIIVATLHFLKSQFMIQQKNEG